MEWNEATIMAIGAAIAGVITAIVAGFIKISEIHKIVNSRDTALRAELNAGKSEIEALKLVVQELTRDKVDMKAEAAGIAATPLTPPGPVVQVEVMNKPSDPVPVEPKQPLKNDNAGDPGKE